MQIKMAVLSVGLLSCIGCTPSIMVVKEFQDPSFSFGSIPKESTVRVLLSDNINVKKFKNSFDMVYQSKQSFYDILKKQIADNLRSKAGCSTTVSGTSQDAAVLVSGSYDQASIDRAKNLFDSSAEKYFLIVKSVDISNDVNTRTVMSAAPSGNGASQFRTSSSEYCVVTIHAEIWDVAGKKKLVACSSNGEAQVIMFLYGTALKSAVGQSVRNMVNYLVSGTTSYY